MKKHLKNKYVVIQKLKQSYDLITKFNKSLINTNEILLTQNINLKKDYEILLSQVDDLKLDIFFREKRDAELKPLNYFIRAYKDNRKNNRNKLKDIKKDKAIERALGRSKTCDNCSAILCDKHWEQYKKIWNRKL